ncbi:hypothetical protein [Gracilibacillus suaedae]|uniref:hypothetical protein n=1 Tax=Gracilibacillus suaedae TaxID=2820273 RepID=UPI001ABECB44|nr:hypothetical protein [Gracilibacillus suaedae]
MAVYITIALGITLLIGLGWFIKSYLDGKTVFNNNSIQQYAYDFHQTKALSTINTHLPKELEILAGEEEQDENEESEEIEDEEDIDETVELENEENLYEGTEQVESSNNNRYYYQDNNDGSSSYNSGSSSSSGNSSSPTVREDVYGG